MRKPTILLCSAAMLLLWGLAPRPASAQDDPSFAMATEPYQAFNGGNIDQVDLFSGNLSLEIPLISYPQQGGKLQFGFSLVYQTGPWLITEYCDDEGDPCEPVESAASTGWQIVQTGAASLSQGGNTTGSEPNNGFWYASDAVGTADGVHQMAPTTNGNAWGADIPWRAIDGSGYTLQFSSSGGDVVMTDPNGIQSIFDPGTGIAGPMASVGVEPGLGVPNEVVDPNGNKIVADVDGYDTLTGWTDSMNRPIPIPATTSTSVCPAVSGQPSPDSAWVWDLPGPSGGTHAVTMCEITFDGGMLQSLVLPDGSYWTFSYDTSYYGSGNLTQATFPTGGSLSYTWNANGPTISQDIYGDTGDSSGSYIVASRTLSAGGVDGPSGTWTYTYTNNNDYASGEQYYTTVEDAAGNDTVYTFSSFDKDSPYETEAAYYQGTSTLLKTVITAYSCSTPFDGNDYWPLYDYAVNVVPTSVTTALNPSTETQESEVTYTYDSDGAFDFPRYDNSDGDHDYSGDWTGTLGLQTSKKEYDYGVNEVGSLLRTTATEYEFQENSSYETTNLLNLPYSVTVENGAGTAQADTGYTYDGATGPDCVCGNPTKVSRWISGATLASTVTGFDSSGRVTSVEDPNGNTTDYSYSTSSCTISGDSYAQYAGSGPSSITDPLGKTTYFCYDVNTGLQEAEQDPDGDLTTTGYDDMLRTIGVTRADGGETTWSYYPGTSSENQVNIAETRDSSSGDDITETLLVDGVGRPYETELTSDPSGTDYTLTDYDAMGRVQYQYNPTRCATITSNCDSESTWGYTSYAYDALSRPLTVTAPDGSATTASYSGSYTTATDAAGKTRESYADGLGRTTEAIEDPSGLDYVTSYSYDALNDLTGVTEDGSRGRTFTYDGLGRLLTADNPESGTTTYTYDGDGNLVLTEDALDDYITRCYDADDRLTAKGYGEQTCSGGTMTSPAETYGYDAAGRRTGMSDTAGSEAWTFDGVGRILSDERVTDGVTRTTTYSYYMDGNVWDMEYPSGLKLTYGYNDAGQPVSVADQNGNTYAASATYAPTGGLSSATLDATANFAGFSYTAGYNSDLQASGIAAGFGSTSVVNLGYCYYALSSGECPSSGTSDNGDVVGVLNNLDGTRSQTFSYDSLNRLSTAASVNTSGTRCWGEQFGYDAWGNLLTIGALSGYSSCAQPDNLSLTVNGANQISDSGFTYDADGRLTGESPGLGTLTYNAEGELTAAGGVDYGYDGDGARVEKSSGASEIDWYGGSGAVLEQTDLSGNLQYDYIFFDGQAVASLDSSGDVYATFGDGLGSTREVEEIASGASSPTSVFDADYYPFGRENDFVDTFNPSFKFTGKERDPETGSDYFGARYTNYTLGRFLTPDWSADPEPVPYASIGDPQSLNLYSYVENNPESGVDPDGHCSSWTNCVASFFQNALSDIYLGIMEIESPGQATCSTSAPFVCSGTTLASADDTQALTQAFAEDPNGTVQQQESLTSAGDAQPGPPTAPSGPTACQQKVLNAVDSQFNLEGNASNILPSSNPEPDIHGGQVNVNFNFSQGLTATQFNAISPGRYAPPGIGGWLTGAGPSLHVVGGPSGLDPNVLTFAKSNIGGNYSVTFTAHLDSAWAYNPIGLMLHLGTDVLGSATRNPCP